MPKALRTPAPLLAALSATLLLPPAAASHPINITIGDYDDCELLGDEWEEYCRVYLEHTIQGGPAFCAGTAGSFTFCNVFIRCKYWGEGGPLLTVTLDCDPFGRDTCGPVVQGTCGWEALGGWITILRGECRNLWMIVEGVTALGARARIDSNFHVCIDGTGPYLV